ncbi:MAG: histidine kinase [Bacteroidetes bacterium]|nr:histidine kinase [Bacteroidota bacterium]
MPFKAGNISPDNQERINKILEVIIAYAGLDFTKKTEVKGSDDDVLDAIGAGVNMLGEELQTSTISLKEKEHLLKEIHHRVKNNLQIVSSLLNLQSESIKDPALLNLVTASRNRIHSIALVHEMLYASVDLTNIEMGDYIKKLSNNIRNSLSIPGSDVQFEFEINPCFLDIDRMVPVGLILNEIITNSFKYAFPNGKGIISIGIHSLHGRYILLIKDNGVGVPAGFELEKNSNLGLQLIKILTEQINGELNINFENGFSYSITFN